MIKSDIRNFAVIGGDKRQLFMAKAISDSCHDVFLGGFDKLRGTGAFTLCTVREALAAGDAVVFPLPSLRADKTVNAPFSSVNIALEDEEEELMRNKPIFVSGKSRFLKACPMLFEKNVFDYAAREDFAILNALPTAEGALECAMREYEGTIFGSRCFVVGFGRIGKLLSKLLSAVGARVTVGARKQSDIAFARALGFDVSDTSAMKRVRGFDLVFNTVPCLLFDKNLLMSTDLNTIIIDLASLPGGVDFESAERLGISAVRALSLPGKCAPKTAGEIIKATVFDIIKEVYG